MITTATADAQRLNTLDKVLSACGGKLVLREDIPRTIGSREMLDALARKYGFVIDGVDDRPTRADRRTTGTTDNGEILHCVQDDGSLRQDDKKRRPSERVWSSPNGSVSKKVEPAVERAVVPGSRGFRGAQAQAPKKQANRPNEQGADQHVRDEIDRVDTQLDGCADTRTSRHAKRSKQVNGCAVL